MTFRQLKFGCEKQLKILTTAIQSTDLKELVPIFAVTSISSLIITPEKSGTLQINTRDEESKNIQNQCWVQLSALPTDQEKIAQYHHLSVKVFHNISFPHQGSYHKVLSGLSFCLSRSHRSHNVVEPR